MEAVNNEEDTRKKKKRGEEKKETAHYFFFLLSSNAAEAANQQIMWQKEGGKFKHFACMQVRKALYNTQTKRHTTIYGRQKEILYVAEKKKKSTCTAEVCQLWHRLVVQKGKEKSQQGPCPAR